jgi:carboxymethylenebutenolidase
MGGGLAFAAAGAHPGRVRAAASFHGSRLVTDTPSSPHLLAPAMRATIYIGVADKDPGHPPEVTAKLDAALTSADVPHTIELYEGAAHGFAVGDTPVFDQAACDRHWDHLLVFFEATLQ